MQTKFVDIPGGRLAYEEIGEGGSAVLLVPGMGALRSEYRFLAPAVKSAGFRAISLDVRGHGESSVPWHDYRVESVGTDLIAFARSLRLDSIHLVGTSKSAGSVVWAAAEAPDMVKSVVLIGPFVRDVPTPGFMRAAMWFMFHNPWKVGSWLAYYRSLYPLAKPGDFDEYLSRLGASLREKGRTEAAYRYGMASLAEADRRLRDLHVPALIVMGTRDPDFTDPTAEAQLLAEYTHGELQLIEGAGHYPQTELPDMTNPLIVEFINRHSLGATDKSEESRRA